MEAQGGDVNDFYAGRPILVDDQPTADAILAFTAGVDIVSGRLMTIVGNQAHYYEPTNQSHRQGLVGVSITSSLSGGNVNIQFDGKVTIPNWNLEPDLLYYVALNGELSPTEYTERGFIQIVGRAITSNALFFNPQPIIYLHG